MSEQGNDRFVKMNKNEVPDFVPENALGHCFHKVPNHPATGESFTKTKTFWRCCNCGFVYTAKYGWVKLPLEGHGRFAPVEYDYEHEEWTFSLGTVTCEDAQSMCRAW